VWSWRVGAAWLFLVLVVAGTVWDSITNKTEPFHVLMLSWGAMDISAAQILIAVLTRRDVKRQDGES
jgi:predicted butyrate kinase (DUF1464 family)